MATLSRLNADVWSDLLLCLRWTEALGLVRSVTFDGKRPATFDARLVTALARRLQHHATGAELCLETRRMCQLSPAMWEAIAASSGAVLGGIGLRALSGGTWDGFDVDVFYPATDDSEHQLGAVVHRLKSAMDRSETKSSTAPSTRPGTAQPGAAPGRLALLAAVGTEVYATRFHGVGDKPLVLRVTTLQRSGGRPDIQAIAVDPRMALLAARAAGHPGVPEFADGVRATFDFALCGLVVVGRHADEATDAALAAQSWSQGVNISGGAAGLCRALIRRQLVQRQDPPGVVAANLWTLWTTRDRVRKWHERGWQVGLRPGVWAREALRWVEAAFASAAAAACRKRDIGYWKETHNGLVAVLHSHVHICFDQRGEPVSRFAALARACDARLPTASVFEFDKHDQGPYLLLRGLLQELVVQEALCPTLVGW